MLSLPSAVQIFICIEPADMRKSFDGLAAMTRQIVGQEPTGGHLFVFRNRKGDRVKLLYWDHDGFALWYKRLEKGMFHMPQNIEGDYRIDPRDLAMMLEGVDLLHTKKRSRYHLKHHKQKRS